MTEPFKNLEKKRPDEERAESPRSLLEKLKAFFKKLRGENNALEAEIAELKHETEKILEDENGRPTLAGFMEAVKNGPGKTVGTELYHNEAPWTNKCPKWNEVDIDVAISVAETLAFDRKKTEPKLTEDSRIEQLIRVRLATKIMQNKGHYFMETDYYDRLTIEELQAECAAESTVLDALSPEEWEDVFKYIKSINEQNKERRKAQRQDDLKMEPKKPSVSATMPTEASDAPFRSVESLPEAIEIEKLETKKENAPRPGVEGIRAFIEETFKNEHFNRSLWDEIAVMERSTRNSDLMATKNPRYEGWTNLDFKIAVRVTSRIYHEHHSIIPDNIDEIITESVT